MRSSIAGRQVARYCFHRMLVWGLLMLAEAPAAQAVPIVTDDSAWSEHWLFYAQPERHDTSTAVYDRYARYKAVWEIPGWKFESFVSDDGEYVVRCHQEIARQRGSGNLPAISIYQRIGKTRHGRLLKSIRRSELFVEPPGAGGPPAGRWGICKGFVSLHGFVAETVERRQVEYDVATGTLAGVTALSHDPDFTWKRYFMSTDAEPCDPSARDGGLGGSGTDTPALK